MDVLVTDVNRKGSTADMLVLDNWYGDRVNGPTDLATSGEASQVAASILTTREHTAINGGATGQTAASASCSDSGFC